MTLDERKAYVEIIKNLYGNSIYVDESMISQEVVDILETIVYEIRNCSVGLGIFASIVNGLGDGASGVVWGPSIKPFSIC